MADAKTLRIGSLVGTTIGIFGVISKFNQKDNLYTISWAGGIRKGENVSYDKKMVEQLLQHGDWLITSHSRGIFMIKLPNSINEEVDWGLTEILIILQDHVDIMSMIQDYEAKAMSASQEIRFLQFILDAGLVWAMPTSYVKRVEEALEKGLIYFN